MKKTIFIVSGIIILVGILVMSVVLYKKGKNSNNINSQPTVTSSQEPEKVAGAENTNYFDENARVMYFYSEYCSWCKKEAEVLKELAPAGYRVKPMDVKAHPEYWQDYQIKGTPAFIADDGVRKTGFQAKEELKNFLDEYK